MYQSSISIPDVVPEMVTNGRTCACSDINLYIQNVPCGITAKELDVVITAKKVSVSRTVEGETAYYLNHELTGTVKAGESFWTFDTEARDIHIQLCKSHHAEVWGAVFVGHEASGREEEEDRKKLMLERFQAENPGFDFSGAEFTGNVPDPQTFLRQT